MKTYNLVFVLFLCCINLLHSQIPYLDSCFSSISYSDLTYGVNQTVDNTNQKLILRLFTPDGDTSSSRKCLLWMHGGGFQTGSYTDSDQVYICEYFAQKGYVTASIEYRLGLGTSSGCIGGIEAEYRAAQDYKAAVRYIKKNAIIYNIDTNQIFVGGSSAGAITAMHCAYWDIDEVPSVMANNLGDFTASGSAGYSDKVAGVVSWAGGIEDTLWLQNETIPFIAIHDRYDMEVPYKTQLICQTNNDYIFGDYLVYKFLNDQKIYTNLFTYYKSIHVPSMGESAYYEWLDTTCQQLYRLTLFEITSPLNSIENLNNNTNLFSITSNHSHIHIDLIENKLPFYVSIFDVLGKKIASSEIQNLKNTITLAPTIHGLIEVVLQNSNSTIVDSKTLFIP